MPTNHSPYVLLDVSVIPTKNEGNANTYHPDAICRETFTIIIEVDLITNNCDVNQGSVTTWTH